MSLSGMTGFARVDGERDGVRWAWEARSVNGRGLDLKLRLPQGFERLEPAVREAAAKRFKRGSVQVSLSLKEDAGAASLPKLNVAHLEELLAAGMAYVDAGKAALPTWDGLLALRGVLVGDESAPADQSALDADLLHGLEAALEALLEARRQEGRALVEIFSGLLVRIENLVIEAKAVAATGPAAIQERIRARLEALAPEIQFDPQRLAQEAAIAAMRADVQEELDRLAAHRAEARALMVQEGPAGRRLDFLAQEFSREANTLCSKSQDLTLTRLGLDLKTAIDQLKEQAANVE